MKKRKNLDENPIRTPNKKPIKPPMDADKRR